MTAISLDLVKDLRERTGAGMMDCKAALQENGGDIEKAIDYLRKKGMASVSKRAGREAKEGAIVARIDQKRAVIVEVNCETDFVARNDDFKKLSTLALDETMAKGEAAVTGDKLTSTVAELTGKIGEKIVVRRAKTLDLQNSQAFSYIHANNKLGVLVELSAGKPESLKNAAVAEFGKNVAMQVAAANPIGLTRAEVPASVVERERAIYKEEIKGKPENIQEKIIQGKLDKFYQTIALVEQPFIKDDKVTIQALLNDLSKKLNDTVTIKRFVRFQLGETLAS